MNADERLQAELRDELAKGNLPAIAKELSENNLSARVHHAAVHAADAWFELVGPQGVSPDRIELLLTRDPFEMATNGRALNGPEFSHLFYNAIQQTEAPADQANAFWARIIPEGLRGECLSTAAFFMDFQRRAIERAERIVDALR